MADSGITVEADGCWVLSGELNFDTVPALLAHKGAGMKSGQDVRVDLANVTRADSAGLALLVEWLRESKRMGLSISFEHVPEQLESIAQISGLEEILFTRQ